MSDEAFAELKEAMEDALAFERGKRSDLKVTHIQAPRPIQAGEQSSREPDDAALKAKCSGGARCL